MKKILWLSLFLFAAFAFHMDFCVAADEKGQQFEEDLDQLKKGLEEMPAPSSSEEQEKPAAVPQTATPDAPGESQKHPNNVVSVEIRGNQIVSTNTILSKIRTQRGQPLQQDVVNEDIKRLYATGYFQDIKMEVEERPDGYALAIAVVEKAIIREIRIEGFSRFKEDKLRKELAVIEGQILDRKAVKQGVEAIRKLYANKGYRFVDIDSEVDVNEERKEATVYVKITEGDKQKIKEVRFEGVTAFKSKKLQKMMKTKKAWFIRSGVFKEEEFQKDLEKVRFLYQQEGYLDVKVQSRFEQDPKENKMIVIISVDEGPKYVTGEIKIEGNKLFPESEIWQQLEMLPGLTYSQYYLSRDIEKIREYYNDRGHIDARIIPDVKLNRESGKVDVTYRLEEGDLYFVDKVLVRGNTKTRDMVIRRELRIRPGERFDGEKIRKSKQRLENLGFFEDVTYDTQPAEEGTNRKDLIFRVKEKRTGELSFGGGVSSVDSFVGFAEISQRNFDLLNFPRFTGGGQSLSVRARIGTITQDYNVNFTEPYLFNKPITLSTDLFKIHRDNRNVDFDEDRLGAGFTLSRLFKDILRIGGGYTLERVKLDNISDDAPDTVRKFSGSNWLSRLRFLSSVDTRDNVFNPTKGTLATLNADLVGSFLGGQQDYWIVQSSYTKYWTVFKKHLVEFRTRLGTSKEFGDSDEVPIFDRFFAGGLGTVRGYNYRRVGPIESGGAVGGQTLAIMNLEYNLPIPRLDAFKAAFFIDAGHINPDSFRFSFSDFAVSVGPGIKVKTPIGPVALYYGLPIFNKDTEDRNGRIEFSLSRGF